MRACNTQAPRLSNALRLASVRLAEAVTCADSGVSAAVEIVEVVSAALKSIRIHGAAPRSRGNSHLADAGPLPDPFRRRVIYPRVPRSEAVNFARGGGGLNCYSRSVNVSLGDFFRRAACQTIARFRIAS